MEQKLTQILAAMLLPALAFGQIVITHTDMPNLGEQLTDISTIDDQPVNVGPSGPNQTWTIPDYPWDDGSVMTLRDPAATAYGVNYPTATHCLTEDTTTGEWNYMYFRLATNGLFMVGMVGRDNEHPATVAVFDQEAMFIHFPLTYLTSWTTVMRFSIEIEPGLEFTFTDSVLATIDGWGTLVTPFGSWPALRMQDHHYSRREIPESPPELSEEYGYEWFTDQGFVGATMESAEEEPNPNFTTGHVTVTLFGAVDADEVRGPVAESFTVGQNYPNPFNPTTSLPIKLEQAGKLEITIYNEMGQVVSHEERAFGPGAHQVPFDGSAWASGTYFANVKHGSRQLTKKMQLIK